MKQVPLHPRERLKKITKKLVHSRDKMKNKAAQLARDNVSALMNEKLAFDPKKILNKTLLLDTSNRRRVNNRQNNTSLASRQRWILY